MKSFAKAALFALTLATAACSSTNYPAQVSALNYGKFQQITFNASRVDVISDYQSRGAPHIDHLMDTSPSQAVNAWAQSNLRATGGTGYVQVRIKDASVLTRDLPQIGGIQGSFTKQQAEELVAHVSAEISGENRDLRFNGYSSAEAAARATVPEEATNAQRKAIEQQLLNTLMTNFITNAQTSIRTHLAPMIVN